MTRASRDFQVFVKPVGAACNMACRYCYYLAAGRFHEGEGLPRMRDDLLERYIAQHVAASPNEEVRFSWHGGEPTSLGLDYFRAIVGFERKHAGAGRRITNGIQTNGLLIDDQWCRFLAAEGFRVGLSIDGPEDLHDAYRVTRGQTPTFQRVMRAWELLQKHHVPCDILCVVHDRNVRHPTRVYRFFRRIGANYLGFLPLVQRAPGATNVTPESVPAEAYGEFLCAVFDEWVGKDTGRIAVQAFEEATRPSRGLEHSLCIFRETCGDMPVVEHNGDFYACDHFVDDAHRFGNLTTSDLGDLIESRPQRAFGEAKRDALPRQCRECDVLAMCNGGCPKDRFIRAADGEEGLNYLCAGFKRFFRHVQPWAARVAREEPGRAAYEELLERRAHPAPSAGAPPAGRNDPCPCGSGKKYKKCCLVDRRP